MVMSDQRISTAGRGRHWKAARIFYIIQKYVPHFNVYFANFANFPGS